MKQYYCAPTESFSRQRTPSTSGASFCSPGMCRSQTGASQSMIVRARVSDKELRHCLKDMSRLQTLLTTSTTTSSFHTSIAVMDCIFFQSSSKDMFIDFREEGWGWEEERGGERRGGQERTGEDRRGQERKTPIGCFSYEPQSGIEPATFLCMGRCSRAMDCYSVKTGLSLCCSSVICS